MSNKSIKKLSVILTAIILIGVAFFSFKDNIINVFNNENISQQPTTDSVSTLEENSDFQVHMINIGIGDSILIKSGNQSMLIDGGENDAGEKVLNYVKNQGVTKLDYIVATHPHSDHMGGLDYVINNFPCDNVIMSTVKESATPTTKTYKDFLLAVSSKKVNVIKAQQGNSFNLGQAKVDILGPVEEYEDLNDSSVVLKITYGATKFLFTGDIEKNAEKDLIESGQDLSANFLKVAHHGSSTSTTAKFLKAVNPKYAAISVDFDNKYNHPNPDTIKKLETAGVEYYLTRNYISLIFMSDRETITVSCKES